MKSEKLLEIRMFITVLTSFLLLSLDPILCQLYKMKRTVGYFAWKKKEIYYADIV